MTEKPLISVVIPCYNAEPYVAAAIDSALAQTYRNVEVIVVDDCSTDNSLEVLRAYGDRISLFHGVKFGPPAARNFGVARSNGQIIQFLDADDLLSPHKLEKQYKPIQENLADFVGCQCQGFGEGIDLHDGPKLVAPSQGDDPYGFFMNKVFLQTGNPLHARRLFEIVGGFSEYAYGTEDPELIQKIVAAGGRFSLVEEPLYLIRHHDSPDRMGNRVKKPGEQLQTWVDHAQFLFSRPDIFKLTPAAAHVLGSVLHQQAIYAFRNGVSRDKVEEGFNIAAGLTNAPDFIERRIYKTAGRILSPIQIESVLALLRKVCGRGREK